MKKLDNYVSNLETLKKAYNEDLDNEFIMGGIIDKFFLQFELGWKVFQELLRYEGSSVERSGSPRAIIKAAYKIFDFMDEEKWLLMLDERNSTAHIYDENMAREMVKRILDDYIPEFIRVKDAILMQYDDVLFKN